MNDSTIYSRRQLLKTASAGFGYLAFAGISARAAGDEQRLNPLTPKAPHFEASAKRVIFLSMIGAPSHVDTFDYKPSLHKDGGKSGRLGGKLLEPQSTFRQRGEGGLWISDLFPNVSKQADELCLLRGMHSDSPNHPTAQTQMHTGNFQFVRPSLGAWTLYGLGTENESLPGFISLGPPPGSSQHYGSSFLPAIYQGTAIGRPGGGFGGGGGRRNPFARQESSIPDIKNPRLSNDAQRKQIDLIQQLNQAKLEREKNHPGVEGVIESYELAFRMQDKMPELMDISQETAETQALYGIDSGSTDTFGRQCLMARRFVESGVRFVEISHANWDHHTNLKEQLPQKCEEIDKPIAGLIADLKRRDMLKDTLIVWAGEFGRTPHTRSGLGRDHNNRGYTTWMAGGGVKGGFSFGETDEHGYEAVTDKTHIHDWHATMLYLLGLDHERLTYRYAGRDFRLTDVAGDVKKQIVA